MAQVAAKVEARPRTCRRAATTRRRRRAPLARRPCRPIRASRRRPAVRPRRSPTSAPASPSSSRCASSSLACCADSEDRDLEHQRRQPAPAAPARVAGRGRARRRRAAGAEGGRRASSRAPRSRTPATARSGRGQKTWNGVALLARGTEPIPSRRALPGDADDTPARATSRRRSTASSSPRSTCRTATRSPGRSSTTSSPGSSACSPMRARWPRAAIRSSSPATTTSCRPTPTSTRRARGAKNALLQPAPRAAYRRLLAQGWTDAIRALHPDERIYTFWDYLRNALGARRRPAHRPPAAERERRSRACSAPASTAHVRGRDNASDHAPVWIELA